MNTNKKVTVLTPNGRRQNVNVESGTTLLQVLEQVCQKHGFSSFEHGFKHHNKEVDLSLMFRYTGLPNNCLLEMFDTGKIRNDDDDVILCVQFEDGTRLHGNFKSSENLSSILNTLCEKPIPYENPVIIYMRKEIFGDLLNSTTLKNLGITGGRAMIRLFNKTPDELKKQASVYIPPTVKIEKKKENDDNYVPKQNISHGTENKNFIVSAIQKVKEEKKLAEEKLTTQKEAPENMNTEDSQDINKNIESKQKSKPDWGTGTGRAMNKDVHINQDDMETESIGEIDEPTVIELGERNAILFSLEEAQKSAPEIPDSFFDLTVDDLKLLLRDLRKQASGNDDAPLLTTKLRELEDNKRILNKIGQYKKCVLRIQFPDRLVLQGTFKPIESIETVYEFVKKYLKDNTINFYLFTIPPKRILPKDKNLLEVDCVPTAVLHFGTDDQPQNENQTFLKEEILTKLTSPDGALLSATKSRMVVNRSNSNSPERDRPGPSSGAIPKKPKNEDFKQSTASTPSSDGKIPKWFKPNKI